MALTLVTRNRRLLRAGFILSLAFLLGGCAAHYGIKGHHSHRAQIQTFPSQFPTLPLEVGETLRAVTPAKGLLVGGFWLSIYIENPEIARPLPRQGDFSKGTDIEAMREGRTRAFYGNAVHMTNERALEEYEGGSWFWIEVTDPNANPH